MTNDPTTPDEDPGDEPDEEPPTSIGDVLRRRAESLGARLSTPNDDSAEELSTEPERLSLTPSEINVVGLARECPRRFRHASLDGIDGPQQAALASWAMDPDDRALVILGPTGTGKTWAAIATAARYLGGRAEHTSVMFRTLVGLLHDMRPGYEPQNAAAGAWDRLGDPTWDPWAEDPVDPVDPRRTACRAGLLILDDVGVQKDSTWVAQEVSDIVDKRWGNELPTIITSNLTAGPDGRLLDALGDRAYSRLVRGGIVVSLNDDDHRRDRPAAA